MSNVPRAAFRQSPGRGSAISSALAGLAFGQDMSFSTFGVPAPHLVAPTVSPIGAFQFVFDNAYDVDFTVLASKRWF
jgi:hypothetical protein